MPEGFLSPLPARRARAAAGERGENRPEPQAGPPANRRRLAAACPWIIFRPLLTIDKSANPDKILTIWKGGGGLKKIAGLLALLLVLTGCASAKKYQKDFFAMDTFFELTAYGKNAPEALDAAQSLSMELDAELDATDPDSALYALNEAGGGSADGNCAALLEIALPLCESTGGAFDITLLRLSQAWGFSGGETRVPGPSEIAALLGRAGWEKVVYGNGAVALPDGAALDFGAIAKGYAGQKLAELLATHGVESAMLSLGGNVQVLGRKPDGTLWSVGIADPADKERVVGSVTVEDAAVVTSGAYQRYFEEGGVRYHHILDPETGYPAQSDLLSVTIITENGALADALSTALFVMGKEKALAYWREHGGFEAVLITEDGRVLATGGAAFTPAEGTDYSCAVAE